MSNTFKTYYGKVKYLETKEARMNIESIDSGKGFCAKLLRSVGILYILEGRAHTNKGNLKKGDLVKFKPNQKISVFNKSKKPLKIIGIDIPPAKQSEIISFTKHKK